MNLVDNMFSSDELSRVSHRRGDGFIEHRACRSGTEEGASKRENH
jgi:hypothetical protein